MMQCWESEGCYCCTYRVCGHNTFLVLNRTSLNSFNALLVLNGTSLNSSNTLLLLSRRCTPTMNHRNNQAIGGLCSNFSLRSKSICASKPLSVTHMHLLLQYKGQANCKVPTIIPQNVKYGLHLCIHYGSIGTIKFLKCRGFFLSRYSTFSPLFVF